LTIKLGIKEGKVNFDKFLYKGTNITTNLPDPKTVITLALKLANNIKASNANPLAASTSISIQIEAPAVKGAKIRELLLNIVFTLILVPTIRNSLYPLTKDLKRRVLAKRKLYLRERNLFSIN